MNFSVGIPTEIIFGPGVINDLGPQSRSCGRHALLVTGRNPERATTARRLLESEGIGVTLFQVETEPTLDIVEAGARKALRDACDFVVGYGGGSVIDAGKAIAALMTNDLPVRQYLEVIGDSQRLQQCPAHYVAIPTTAGTGSEVTRNAVLASPEHRVKVSFRSILMCPDVAFIDPELTLDLPPEQTAASGLDALSQVIEPFLSRKANPFTDALCRDAIRRAGRSLRKTVEEGSDLFARTDMCAVSLFSGMALANAGLGAVHGIAGPLGGYASEPAPHGAVCARLLPEVMEANLRHASEVDKLPARFAEVAQLLTGNKEATAEDGLTWIRQLVSDLQIPGLSSYGILPEDVPILVEKAQAASSMKGNPVELTDDELSALITAAL